MNDLIAYIEFGSHLYGTNTPSSDKDYKAIRLPSKEEILLGKVIRTKNSTTGNYHLKNTSEDVDTEVFSLCQYLKLLLEAQAVAIDVFFAPKQNIIQSSPLWEVITAPETRYQWLHRDIAPYVGYCRQQANKYGIKGSRVASARKVYDFFASKNPRTKLKDFWNEIELLASDTEFCELSEDFMRGNPQFKVRMFDCCNRKVQEHVTAKEAASVYKILVDNYGLRALMAEKNEGCDWKALSHAVRICGEAVELLLTHNIIFPRPDAKLLTNIKLGMYQYKEVAEMIERGWLELEEAQKKTTLPEKPDFEFRDKFIMDIYENIVRNT